MADARVPTEREALNLLISVASEALNAYRAIFGRTCWNDRDRQAFRKFQGALEAAGDASLAAAYASRRRVHLSLRSRMADRNLPARLSALIQSAPRGGGR